ncbi:hypothetical protein AAVH_12609 [Aphelenchoides avenae]|nr:hypothetical protein AAVH_12609 [Aphelenchus avenae]
MAPKDFSLSSLLKSTRLYRPSGNFIRVAGGKSVVRPSRVQTAWLHFPAIMDEPYNLRQLTEEESVMIHMRTWRRAANFNATGNTRPTVPLYERQIADFLSPTNCTVSALGDAFTSFVREYAQREYDALPSKIRYFYHIEKCYGRTFYHRNTSETETSWAKKNTTFVRGLK